MSTRIDNAEWVIIYHPENGDYAYRLVKIETGKVFDSWRHYINAFVAMQSMRKDKVYPARFDGPENWRLMIVSKEVQTP